MCEQNYDIILKECTGNGRCIENQELRELLKDRFAGRKEDPPCKYNCVKVKCPICTKEITQYALDLNFGQCGTCYRNNKNKQAPKYIIIDIDETILLKDTK